MAAYNYTTFVQALVAAANIPADNAGLVAYLPTIIGQAEGMIYREPELQFLSTVVIDDTSFTMPDQQRFTLPRPFVILQDINIVNGNDRQPLIKISREALNFIWPRRISNSISDMPVNWAPDTDNIVWLGPTPGGIFQLECIGNAQPAQMSAVNPAPWLWQNLGDFAFAAAMYFTSGYMRNFGSQADDPKMASSWKDTYDRLKVGAVSDETKRKFQGSGGS